jgi:hypothetical protein
VAGKRDTALQFNSFADHFLTDAFSAGHLFNKVDLMEKFKRNLAVEYQDRQRHSKSYARWIELIAVIHGKFPVELDNLVVKVSHDFLNTVPGGIPVQNAKGDGKSGDWTLSGDFTLNAKSLEVGQKAVAQSQINVIGAFKHAGTLDYLDLYKKVWDYVPYPNAATSAWIKSQLNRLADPADSYFSVYFGKLAKDYLQSKIVDVVAKIKAQLHAVVAWIEARLKTAAGAAIKLVHSLINNPTLETILSLIKQYGPLAKELFSPRLPTLGPGAGSGGTSSQSSKKGLEFGGGSSGGGGSGGKW